MNKQTPDLQAYAFLAVGRWMPSKAVRSGITFALDSHEKDRVVYAFAVDGRAEYIGICEKDSTTLAERMNRYRRWQGAGTNERIARRIRECLNEGRAVEILALKPDARISYLELAVDLVKGLENPLIERLKPAWNR
jgi:hypothetical protein